MNQTTYLHKNTEVVLTGRTAVRTKKSRRPGGPEQTESILHEVTPKDPSTGSWTDWVTVADLYVIKEKEDV